MKKLPKRVNKTDDWLTPPELVRSLGAFDLDPCASRRQAQKLAADEFRLPEENGLLLPWFGRVWCNPPFSEMSAWVNRFVNHGNGVMICPLRCQVKWSQPLFKFCDALFLFREKIRWLAPDGVTKINDLFDFMLAAIGPSNQQSLRNLSYKGVFIPLTPAPARGILASLDKEEMTT